MTDDKVVVEEVKPAEVSKESALRMLAGKFIVDFVETLAVSIPVGILFLPSNMEEVSKLLTILAVPVGSALVSAARRNWPTIREWLSPSEGR